MVQREFHEQRLSKIYSKNRNHKTTLISIFNNIYHIINFYLDFNIKQILFYFIKIRETGKNTDEINIILNLLPNIYFQS